MTTIPAAGELIGWAVFYGERLQHCAAVVRCGDHDLAYANTVAIRHRGILVEMHAGAMSDPAGRASLTSVQRDAFGAR